MVQVKRPLDQLLLAPVQTMHFHRRLGAYLSQNHPHRLSGKLTPRQRRRLWKKNRAEMTERRATYAGTRKLKDWS